MADVLPRMLLGVTLGLLLVLLLRRGARKVFGAGAAFCLWLLPVAMLLAPSLPQPLRRVSFATLPALTVSAHAATSAAHAGPLEWPQWLAVAWALGAAVMVLRLTVDYTRLLRGARRPAAAWTRVLEDAAPDVDMRRVRVHAAGPGVLWAFPRVLVLLPADFAERFAPSTRDPVLRHELAHVRRGDAWWNLAMEIATALLWFHPLVLFARSRFRLDQELACDAATLRAEPACAAGYARALLDSVATRPATALIPWLDEPQLKERITMIARTPPGALRRGLGTLSVAAMLAAGLYVAGGQSPAVAADPGAAGTPPTVDSASKDANPPAYPDAAIRNGQQGTVMLDVSVDATGGIEHVEVDPKGTTAPADLQHAAMRAANGWKFKPGNSSGKPVGGVVRVPVRFSMGEGIKPCKAGEVHALEAPYACVPASSSAAS